MAEGPFEWLRALWAYVDERLASFSAALQRIVRMLRVVRAVLILAILAVFASGAVAILWALGYLSDLAFAISYAVAITVLVVPVIVLTILVGLPLRAKSVIRLIDQGYPANARELAIRVAARKLRDQSIETEELLVETATNEARKVYNRYKARAEAMESAKAQGERDAADGPAA